MSGKSYSYGEVSYRLMHYKGTIYKFKIEFSDCSAGKNHTRRILTPSETDQVDRTIGVLAHQKYKKTDVTNALQTTDFLIRCTERPWKIVKKVGFRLRGKELRVHDFMFVLNVEPKQTRATVVLTDVMLRERPFSCHTDSQEEPQRGGSTQNNAVEKRQSSSRQGPKSRGFQQETFSSQLQKAAQEPKPLPRLIRSCSRQQHEIPPTQVQRISRVSPKLLHKSQNLSRNETSPKQLQKSHEVSPRQVRKSPRSGKSPTQLQQSSAVSPRQHRTTAKLSEHENASRQGKKYPEVSPRIFSKNRRFPLTRSSQSSPMKSPEKHGIPEVSSRFLRRSPRFRPARSSQSGTRKLPDRSGVLDRFSPNPSKTRLHRHSSVGSEDDTIRKRLRSDSTKLLMSDVTATEKLLHPLDKEFVRREYEQEELRLRNLAKPSTSSADRKAWLSSL